MPNRTGSVDERSIFATMAGRIEPGKRRPQRCLDERPRHGTPS
jgi:hypothetical protein